MWNVPELAPAKARSGRQRGTSATCRATVLPGVSIVPPAGAWATIVPGAVPGAGTVLVVVRSPRLLSDLSASPSYWPVTVGSLTGAGPALSTTVTRAPSRTRV